MFYQQSGIIRIQMILLSKNKSTSKVEKYDICSI